MSINRSYSYKTNYFNRPWTWVKRIFVFFFMIMTIIYSEFVHPGQMAIKFLFLILCALYIFLKPKDDLAVDERYLYHLKKSIHPYFSRTTKYDITRIKSIRIGGIYSPQFEVMELLGKGFSNSIEITFKDNSSKTLNLPIYKKELIIIASRVKHLIRKN